MEKYYANLLDAFWDQVATKPKAVALGLKRNGQWATLSWTLVGEKTASLATALRRSGVQAGDRVALFSDNCPEWVITDFATMAANVVSVPIYATQTADQLKYVIEHAGAKVVIVRGNERLQKVKNLSTVKQIVVIDGAVTSDDPRVISFEKFLEQGSPDWRALSKEARSLDLTQLATIVYTSGTTANPKGVMLTHANNLAQSRMLAKRSHRKFDDVIFSFLPLSHITERANLYRQAMLGYAIYFAQSIDTIAQEIKEIRPTSFVAVPRIWEKFQEGILIRSLQAEPKKKQLLEKTLNLGRTHFHHLQNEGRAPFLQALRLKMLQKLVGKKVKEALGLDRCKYFVSGAAPLSLDTIIFFYALGIKIAEGYGLTECAGASHLNDPFTPFYGTVGPHLDGLECKIAPDGEILLRGANVFAGYYNEPELTRECLIDGWLHTGDIGVYDQRGTLRITDRKKNIIVTSGGKNIAPAPLEAKIKRCMSVNQAVVIGDRRKFLTALITLSPEVPKSSAEDLITKHINDLNATLPSYETIKKFVILDNDFSIEGGELTPTLKTKRGFIQEKYKSAIDALYALEPKEKIVATELASRL